jgi:tetracycline repressor-like protein
MLRFRFWRKKARSASLRRGWPRRQESASDRCISISRTRRFLFRLQSDEWRQTTELLRGILEDVQRPPLERLRTLVHAFIRSECEEAAMRVALNDAAPLYRDAPEAQEARASGDRTVQVFMREALPKASEATRALAGDLITTTLSEVGKQFSETPRTSAEIGAYADAMADMFCAYLRALERGCSNEPDAASSAAPGPP